MTVTIRRFKDRREYTAAELLHHMQTGDPVETDEYKELRAKVLEEAGIADNAPAGQKPVKDMTAQDHLNRLKGRQR